MTSKNSKAQQRQRRQKRIRAKIFGTSEKPRLSVFRSNRHLSAQLIDDEKGVTLAFATTQKITSGTPLEKAKQVGALIAEEAKKKGITTVIFDRGGYIYLGRVQAIAMGAREGGLVF